MGERIINPLFNVQDKYKEMNIINPYKYSSVQDDITYVDSTTTYNSSSNTNTCNKPSGTNEGDVMLAFVNVNYNSATITPPSGWTVIDTVTSSPISATMQVLYKVAGVSEPSSYQFSFSTTRNRVSISTYTNVYSTPINAYSFTKNATTTSQSAVGITTITDNCLLVWVVGADESNSTNLVTPPSGMVEDADHSGAAFIAWCSKIFPSAGSTGTLTGIISRSTNCGVSLIALTP